ncbi:MAG: hypothetical protein J6L69_06335 [Lachnospiraceae bacterium]|nr:hypothetical protein [Lachnospiraceae bacterium]
MKLRKISTWIFGFSVSLVVIVILIAVLYMTCTKAFAFGEAIFSEEGVARTGQGEDVFINIPVGATKKEVANILFEEGLIEDENIFVIQMFIYEGKINSGVYKFNTENPPEVIIEKITEAITVDKDGVGEN